MTIWLSMLGFVLHLLLILLNNVDLLSLQSSPKLLESPISAIYTPFSIILIYEIYLLVLYIPRSFTTAVSKQFEIISLILIRKIFSDIPDVEMNVNWITQLENRNLIIDLAGVLVVYFMIYVFNRKRLELPKKPITEKVRLFINYKKVLSLIILPVLVIFSITSFVNWSLHISEFEINASNVMYNINSVFYDQFFTILILADVLILLLSLRYTESYNQLIRNTGFIICTILIRLSFGSEGLTNVLLIASSVIFGYLILNIYLAFEKLDLKLE